MAPKLQGVADWEREKLRPWATEMAMETATDGYLEPVRDEELDVALAAGLVQHWVWVLAQDLAADRAIPVRVALLAVREAVRRELELERLALAARAVRRAEAEARAAGPAAAAAKAPEPAQEPARGPGAPAG